MSVQCRSVRLGAARLLCAPIFLLSACTGQIGGVQENAPSGGVGAGTSGGPTRGSATSGGSSSTAGASTGSGGTGTSTGTGPPPAMCVSTTPLPGPSPLRRLTHREYDNTIRQLLGDVTDPAKAFAAEEQVLGFDNNAEARGVTTLLAEQYMNAAEQIALRAAKDLPKLMGCAPADAAARDACASQFIQAFGKRAFRRPLEPAETTRLGALYATGRDKYGFAVAVQLVLQAFLQSPHFLYRVEFGATAPAGTKIVSIGPWELASRLSYLLWGSMPDDELFRAAETGQLTTKDQALAQVARMMKDPRVDAVLADFHRQWLELDKVDTVEKDAAVVQGFTDDLRPLLRKETETLVSSILASDKPDLRSLLTAPYSFMNAKLASFYGIKGPTTDAFERVATDPAQRAGILTQGSVLAVHAHANQTSPVHRGLFVRRQLLCNPPPPPPANVVVTIPNPDPNLTTRERFARHSTDAYCASCHTYLDPIGLGFETFDPVGRLRTAENGRPIDASGRLLDTDVDGSFAGAADLANKLAGSAQVAGCLVTEWFRYAYGRDEVTGEDGCSKALLADRFAKSGQNVRELLLALTQTDAFMYRTVAEGEMR